VEIDPAGQNKKQWHGSENRRVFPLEQQRKAAVLALKDSFNFIFHYADNNVMKKISAVFVFFLAIGGLLRAQSEEPIAVETEAPVLSADTASITGNFRQEGIASWYGAEFAGRATASGEIFDPAQLTAAHADLPFGTYLVVTNTENGKRIAVRVNDRGPFVRSRILDVSRAAAERLDMLTAGTAKVVIESTTREAAQSLVRELGGSAATAGITSAAPRATTPASSGAAIAAPSTPQAAASRATAPASSETAATAAPSTPQTAASRAPAPASSETAATAAPSTPQAAASRATAPAASSETAAAATPPVNTAGTPVMAPTAPRTPGQPVITPVPVPSASVSRVTGQMENIPEIRRPSDSGYVVVDEQVPLDGVSRTASPVIMPAPSAASAPTEAPASAPTAVPASAPTEAPASASAVAPLAAEPAVTPVSIPPQSEPESLPQPPVEPQPAIEPNPAASVPVTGPRPGAEKIEFTGSPIVQGKNYRVQVGSFVDLKNASETFLKLSDAGLNPSYERYEDKYRVVITDVKAEDADDLSRKLAEIGITEALAREDAGR
jgi:rare lipoprotein A (peptidoglycan hydrolase)